VRSKRFFVLFFLARSHAHHLARLSLWDGSPIPHCNDACQAVSKCKEASCSGNWQENHTHLAQISLWDAQPRQHSIWQNKMEAPLVFSTTQCALIHASGTSPAGRRCTSRSQAYSRRRQVQVQPVAAIRVAILTRSSQQLATCHESIISGWSRAMSRLSAVGHVSQHAQRGGMQPVPKLSKILRVNIAIVCVWERMVCQFVATGTTTRRSTSSGL
jgi:hypothetical protein